MSLMRASRKLFVAVNPIRLIKGQVLRYLGRPHHMVVVGPSQESYIDATRPIELSETTRCGVAKGCMHACFCLRSGCSCSHGANK